PNSYERVQSGTKYNGSWNWGEMRDVMSFVPNVAGHTPNKGGDANAMINMVRNMEITGSLAIPSVTSRFRSPQGMVYGAVERVTFGGKRSNMIGWETPAQHRLESRLAGADADPYITTAAELASVYDAVVKHVRPATGQLNETAHT